MSCDLLQKEVDAVQAWTIGRKLKCDLQPISRIDNVKNICESDLGSCLPPQVLEYHGKMPAVNGPNCWNLAMVMSGVLPALRYSDDNEMAFFMRSPLCRKLNSYETKRPGDIGAIRSVPKGNEVHGFMWVSDNLVYSKNGKNKGNPYALQLYTPMNEAYVDLQQDVCKINREADCAVEVDTLRCKSMESYLEDPKRMVPKKIREAFIRLEYADRCISTYNFSPGSFNYGLKKNLIDNVQVLAALFDSEEFKKSVNTLPKDQRDFLVGSFSLRLESMYKQMDMTSKDLSPCLTCYLLSREILQAAQKVKK